MNYSTLLLSEITSQDVVGGKARGLAALIAAGFPVPEGFVVSPEATPEEIIAAYRRVGTPRVAVRSSAADEDSSRFSYAGQFETFLNISGEEALLRAVEACRASVLTTRGATYREYPNRAASRMCVIVQRMIESEYAGVAFADSNGEFLVEGVIGLGDRLVSGRARPSVLPEDLHNAVERVARVAVERLGGALDIEWAAEQGRIWLLQARPLSPVDGRQLPRGDSSTADPHFRGSDSTQHPRGLPDLLPLLRPSRARWPDRAAGEGPVLHELQRRRIFHVGAARLSDGESASDVRRWAGAGAVRRLSPRPKAAFSRQVAGYHAALCRLDTLRQETNPRRAGVGPRL